MFGKSFVIGFFVFVLLTVNVSALSQVVYDGFESGGWTGGVGWTGGWFHQGSNNAAVVADNASEGNYALRLRAANGYVDRQANVAGYENLVLSFRAKVLSYESSDYSDFLVSGDGVNWYLLKEFTPADSDNLYHSYSYNLSDFGITNDLWVGIDSQGNSVGDILFVDEIRVTSTTEISPRELTRWHIQYNPTPTNMTNDVEYWNFDLFDVPASEIARVNDEGVYTICYFSAGSYEDWRSDEAQFPASVKGNSNGWPGERWIDIRSPIVRQIMADRMDLGISKGCDGFDPDNMDAYSNGNTGFPLTEQDAIDYYNFLANYSHSHGKGIGLKNALDIIPEVMSQMDWAINEQCFEFNECGVYNSFLNTGKPVFHIEYPHDGLNAQETADEFCPQANALGLSTLIKTQQLDAFELSCIDWGIENAVCGNFVWEIGEQCDDGNLNNNDGCSSLCAVEMCGDGIKQASEQCDENDFGGLVCSDLGYDSGSLGCRVDCRYDSLMCEVREGCPWDQDGNGVVTSSDRGFISANIGCLVGFGNVTCDLSDLDGNGVVNSGDRGFISANIGSCL